jgi:hypothetical protein
MLEFPCGEGDHDPWFAVMVHILCLDIKRLVRNAIAREEARARYDIQSIDLNKEAKVGTVLNGRDKEFAAREEFEIDDLEVGH